MTNIVRLTAEPVTSIINEEEVTPARLASILEAAVIEQRVDSDGDIYVSDGLDFPAWISISEDQKLLEFLTYFDPEASAPDNVYARTNDVNRSVMVVQFSWQSDKLWGQYWLSYDGGLNVKHFIQMLRKFSIAFSTGMERFKS